MNVKKWFDRGAPLEEEIDESLRERGEAFAKACKVTPTLVKDKVQTCGGGTSREDWIIKYIEKTDEANAKTDELYKIKCETLSIINKVDNELYRRILISRCLENKHWGEIAAEVGKTEVNVRTRLYRSALKAVTQYLV